MCQVSSDGGRQKIAKAIWRFHPTARRHVFDAVLKHGWPSAPCHGANMVGGGGIKTTPVRYFTLEDYLYTGELEADVQTHVALDPDFREIRNKSIVHLTLCMY